MHSRAKMAHRNRSGEWLASPRDWLAQVMLSKWWSELVNLYYENILETHGDWPLLPVRGEVDN
jgi:hypothetical protein